MIKKIDLYIIKRFLGTFVFSIVIIMSIAIIFDIQEKYEEFIKNSAPLKEIIVDYYLNFIPYYVNLFSAMFVFISVIYFTSKMASNTEIIAIHASGISFNRFLRPYMISASIIAILSWFLIMYIIPESNKIKLTFEDKYVFTRFQNWDRNIHKQVRPGIFVYMESYNVDAENAFRFSIEKYENGKMISKLTSDYARWNPDIKKWDIYNYTIRNLYADKQTIVTGQIMDTTFYLTPEDFKMRTVYVERMNIDELNEYIDVQKLQGTENINRLLVQKYQRWAYPFSTFILTILGVSLANRKKRGGTVINIVIGLALSFSYIMLMQVSTTFTVNSDLDPRISVWIPNLLYACIAYFLYLKAKI
jgi:lipopolysaccharide export system permease protein